MNYKIEQKNKSGFAAIVVLIALMSLVLIITVSLTVVVITKNNINKILVQSAQSYYSAESGIEDGLLRIMKSYNYTAINNFNLGDSVVTQNISQVGDTSTIESLSSHFDNERKVKTDLTLTADGIGFYYGVQVGEGGLYMENNSAINGSLYSDGNVVGTSNTLATINGDVFVATGMNLAHSWSVYNADSVFGQTSPIIDVAQSFKPDSSAVLSQISFYIKKIGNPSDKIIRVFTDDGNAFPQPGSPTKTEIGSTTLIASKIGTNYGWVDFSFSSPPSLVANQWYWIVIDIMQSNSKYFSIGKDSNKGNGNGVSKYVEDWNVGTPIWTEDTGDFNFKTWFGGVSTSLNTVNVTGNAHAHSIVNSNICGDAYYQTIDAASLDFLNIPTDPPCPTPPPSLTSGTAYPDSPDPAVVALPVSDSNIADWKAAASAGGTFSDNAHCLPTVDITLNSSVLDCDFLPTAGIVITINGTVWVKGNIVIGIGTGIKLSAGYGGNSGIIIADDEGFEDTSGKVIINNNVGICGSEGFSSFPDCNPTNGSYVMILSTHNHNTTYAIDVSNNASGAIFYAHKGIANINNGANLKEVTAYKLKLSQNASVTYESGLANASFTSGPEGGWVINDWKEIQ
ncbi:MAG: hypothetical protein P1P85_01925 [Patescibacteria group bacterium]|nr:hypothetical protein [Patescibacteria group bacterium]